MVNGLILVAGKGTRMRELTKFPKCLTSINGKPLIELIIQNFKKSGINNITLVTGFKHELLKKYGKQVIFNKKWKNTNMLYSLLCARDLLKFDTIVSYGDILYNSEIIKELKSSKCNLTFAYDPNWKKLWSKRFENPLDDAETFRINSKGYIKDIGSKTNDYSKIQGQYMGIFKLKGGVIFKYLENLKKFNFEKSDMTSFLSELIKNRKSIKGIPYTKKWAELDSPSDLKFFYEIT